MTSIRNKIIIYLLLPFAVIVGGYFFTSNLLLKNTMDGHIKEETMGNSVRIADIVKDGILTHDYEKLTQAIFEEKRYAENITYITVFDEEKKVLASTLLGDYSPKLTVFEGGNFNESSSTNLDYEETKVLNVDNPVLVGLHQIGMVRVGYNFVAIQKEMNKTRYWYIIISVFALIFLIAVATRLSHFVVKPVKELSSVVSEFTLGKREIRARVRTNDEIGKLSSVFNEMADNLEKKEETINEEKKMTAKKIKELEAWQKATVGRELRMTELKKELKKYKEGQPEDN